MASDEIAAKELKNSLQLDASSHDEWLLIGRIVGAHGLNGHVKVFPESDFPERFTQPGDRWLKKPNGKPVQVKLTSGRYLEGKNQYLVKLEGVNFRDQAEDLRKAELLVPERDRLALEPGEFHVSDLIGLTVILQSDTSVLGTVSDVFTTGHDMLEVVLADQGESTKIEADIGKSVVVSYERNDAESPHSSMRSKGIKKLKRQAKRKKKKPKTLLIPFVEEMVPVVDLAAGQIEINPPPGLLDL
ncbi:MAG: ribosome maturation factor RimM [Cyanobacteria bacterium P01_D01_bin.105]